MLAFCIFYSQFLHGVFTIFLVGISGNDVFVQVLQHKKIKVNVLTVYFQILNYISQYTVVALLWISLRKGGLLFLMGGVQSLPLQKSQNASKRVEGATEMTENPLLHNLFIFGHQQKHGVWLCRLALVFLSFSIFHLKKF